MSDPALIAAAVNASGLSPRHFATAIMSRDERTIRRWIAGDVAIPPVAREWLTHWLALSDSARYRIVKSLEPAGMMKELEAAFRYITKQNSDWRSGVIEGHWDSAEFPEWVMVKAVKRFTGHEPEMVIAVQPTRRMPNRMYLLADKHLPQS